MSIGKEGEVTRSLNARLYPEPSALAPAPPVRLRANYIGAPHFFNLNMACRAVADAFGPHVYLVGSSLLKRDYRDVDVRCILPDEEWARLFPGVTYRNASRCAAWSLTCASLAMYLSQHLGLPVDFQFQPQTEANADFPGERHSLGLFYAPQGSR